MTIYNLNIPPKGSSGHSASISDHWPSIPPTFKKVDKPGTILGTNSEANIPDFRLLTVCNSILVGEGTDHKKIGVSNAYRRKYRLWGDTYCGKKEKEQGKFWECWVMRNTSVFQEKLEIQIDIRFLNNCIK